MKLVSSLALAAALVLGSASAPAIAQKKGKEEAPKAEFSAAESNALAPLQKAVTEKNWEAAKAGQPARQAEAQ